MLTLQLPTILAVLLCLLSATTLSTGSCYNGVPSRCDCSQVRWNSDEYMVGCQSLHLYVMPNWPTHSRLLNDWSKAVNVSFRQNYIQSIPDNYFKISGLSLNDLDLSLNRISRLNSYTFTGLTLLKKLNLSTNSLTDLGDRSTFAPVSQLESLDLSYNSLDHACKLKVINLRSLNLAGNRIKSLDSNCFVQVPHLSFLNLSENEIERIHLNTFNRIPAMQTIIIDGNRIAGHTVSSLLPPSNVRKMSLESNGLTTLGKICQICSPSMVTRLKFSCGVLYTQLGFFSLADNNIKSLGEYCFFGCKRTRMEACELAPLELRVDRNKLVTLEHSAFTGLNQRITTLGLNGNLIQSVGTSLYGLQRIATLEMEDNNISSLGDLCRWESVTLITLRLSKNHINIIPKGCFKNKPNLAILVLRCNLIYTLGSESVSGLGRLITLDLTDNRLTGIASNAFRELVSLQKLRLAGNFLTTLNECTFVKLAKMSQFYYGQNTFHCGCHLAWLAEFVEKVKMRSKPHLVPLDNDRCSTPPSKMDRGIYVGSGIGMDCHQSDPPRCSESRLRVASFSNGSPDESGIGNMTVNISCNILLATSDQSAVIEFTELNTFKKEIVNVSINRTSSVTLHNLKMSGRYLICMKLQMLVLYTRWECILWPEVPHQQLVEHRAGGRCNMIDNAEESRSPNPGTYQLELGRGQLAVITLSILICLVIALVIVAVTLMRKRRKATVSQHLGVQETVKPDSSCGLDTWDQRINTRPYEGPLYATRLSPHAERQATKESMRNYVHTTNWGRRHLRFKTGLQEEMSEVSSNNPTSPYIKGKRTPTENGRLHDSPLFCVTGTTVIEKRDKESHDDIEHTGTSRPTSASYKQQSNSKKTIIGF